MMRDLDQVGASCSHTTKLDFRILGMDNREDKDSDQEKQPQRQPQQGRTPGAFVGMRNL